MEKKKYINFLNKKLPLEEKLNLSLKNFFGIGKVTSLNFCNYIGVNPNIKINELTSVQVENLEYLIKRNYISNITNSLRLFILNQINKKKINKSYKGFRHKLNLPVNGQKTRTNAKTQKNKNLFRTRKAYRKKKTK